MGRMLARVPVYKFKWNLDSGGDGNITTSAWTELLAATSVPSSALEVFNSSEQIIKLSTGSVGSENGSEIQYYVLPGGSSILLPIEVAKGKRLSAKAVSNDATMGYLVLNFFA